MQFTIDSVGNSIPAAAAVRENVARQPAFEKTGQNPVVVGTFKLRLEDYDTSAALVQKISADFVRANAVVGKIHNSIQSGIDAFSRVKVGH